jgi:hypothetical protein
MLNAINVPPDDVSGGSRLNLSWDAVFSQAPAQRANQPEKHAFQF